MEGRNGPEGKRPTRRQVRIALAKVALRLLAFTVALALILVFVAGINGVLVAIVFSLTALILIATSVIGWRRGKNPRFAATAQRDVRLWRQWPRRYYLLSLSVGLAAMALTYMLLTSVEFPTRFAVVTSAIMGVGWFMTTRALWWRVHVRKANRDATRLGETHK